MTLDHLSDGAFEELTYDLLSSLGFTNLDWRRGSGKGGATADQGRDIVGRRLERDVDGSQRLETWFVQCKHYEKGVPPDKLQGAVTWATSERPHVLLFVVSNFLSNPAKNWLQSFEENTRPPFRIKIWERKTLETLLSSQPALLLKYELKAAPQSSVHRAHLSYAIQPAINSVDYFFQVFEDTFDSDAREALLGLTMFTVLNPSFREPTTGDEMMADLLAEDTSYGAFRKKCFSLVRMPTKLGEEFVVQAIVHSVLAWAWRFADVKETEAAVRRNKDAIEYFTKQLASASDPKRRATLEPMIRLCEEAIAKSAGRRVDAEDRYRTLCEHAIPRLYLEDALSDPRHQHS
jgi:hypothetical protein